MSVTPPQRPLLLVEDSPDDVFFLTRIIKTKGYDVPLVVASDGREAIKYLGECIVDSNTPRKPLPLLVLLDLQLPYFTGLQVLEWIRKQPSLKALPVVIFSSSSQLSDVNAAYQLGANSYLAKPTDVTELSRIVESLYEYWLKTNSGPGLTL